MKDQRCELCRFWEERVPLTGWGRCRRYPPQIYVTGMGSDEGVFEAHPDSWKSHWCGEFKEKEGDEQD